MIRHAPNCLHLVMAWVGWVTFSEAGLAAQIQGPATNPAIEVDLPWYSNEGEIVAIEPLTTDTDYSALRNVVAPIQPPKNGTWDWLDWLSGWWQSNWNWWLQQSWLSWLLYLGLFLALAVVVFLLIRMIVNTTATNSIAMAGRRRGELADQIKDLPFELDVPMGDCRRLAELARQSGDYSRAIVYLFSHVLLFLNDLHVLKLQRGKTNRQYLIEVRKSPLSQAFLGKLTTSFERVFFGNHPMDPVLFDAYWSELPSFENQVRSSTIEGDTK